ncbi:hypothetical protein T190_12225 [Sinorhizobium meliloti CCBAU 01290]|nr:hypothetical protein T190_12225 [Sinorhizobium meliloti CCBAU 01290]
MQIFLELMYVNVSDVVFEASDAGISTTKNT